MANLNIGAALATVNTLANLPVDKGTIYATLSAPTNLSLVSAMYQGQRMEVVINPTATFTQTFPTSGGYNTTFGDTLPLSKNCHMILTITCIGSGQYLLYYDSNAGNKYNGYEYVDLGLPSGLLWATCNVGASQPHEYGKYFQWGATEGYYSGTTEAANHSTIDTAPFNNGSSSYDRTYFESISGTVCPNGTLAIQYDAARTNMGGEWRMPTTDEMLELVNYTTRSFKTVSGVNGVMFTSKSNSSNSIFLPASGNYNSGTLNRPGITGYVWSSSLYQPTLNGTWTYCMFFNTNNSNFKTQEYVYHGNGLPIRGVIG